MNFNEEFPNYDVDENGNVYKNNVLITPFKSNKYLQVLLFDLNGDRRVCGVHTLVAMKYIDGYEKGCVVHHKDGDTHNNKLENLEILSRSEHSKLHVDTYFLANYTKEHGSWNKGLKMNDEYREICRNSARKRGFNGNQYIDKYGNKRN